MNTDYFTPIEEIEPSNNNDIVIGEYVRKDGRPLNGVYVRYTTDEQEFCWITNGNLYTRHLLPLVPKIHENPVMNFYNYFFASEGNDSIDYTKALTRVIEGRKPAGDDAIPFELVPDIEKRLRSDPHNLDVIVRVKDHIWEGHKEIFVCLNKTFGEVYNLERVYDQYQLYDNFDENSFMDDPDEQCSWKEYLKNLADVKIPDVFFNEEWWNPVGEYSVRKTGLLLGYPIETTFGIATHED